MDKKQLTETDVRTKYITPTLSEQIASMEDSKLMKTWERRATVAFFDSLFETSGKLQPPPWKNPIFGTETKHPHPNDSP